MTAEENTTQAALDIRWSPASVPGDPTDERRGRGGGRDHHDH